MSLYEVKGLKYGYRWGDRYQTVLNEVSLEIPENSFSCLVGPSGMGKTTLLNLMGLLDKPHSGEISLAGKRVNDLSEKQLENLRLRELGFVFQAFYLIPTLTVFENTTYFLPSLGLSSAEIKKRGMDTLESLGIAEMRNKKPLELSGGQRQRVAIARALVKKPKVILADEPTANLDRKTAEETIAIFRTLHSEDKVSFVFSTHDNHLVSYAKQVYQVRDGRVLAGAES